MSSSISTEDFPNPAGPASQPGSVASGPAAPGPTPSPGPVASGPTPGSPTPGPPMTPAAREAVPGPPVASISAAALAASEPDVWPGQRTAVPWYGLDEAWGGGRWLGSIMLGPDGAAEYGTLGHGDHPARRPDDLSPRRFCGVV